MFSDYPPNSSFRIAGLSSIGLIIAAIFAADYLSSLEIVWGLAYIVPVIICGAYRSRKLVLWLSVLCVCLVIIGYCLPTLPDTGKFWTAFINRLLTILAIVVAAILVQGKIRVIGQSIVVKDSLLAQVDKTNQMALRLAKSNHDLEQFIYLASHDLQEPLRMVASYTKLLRRKYDGKFDEKANRFMFHIVNGAKRMQLLINDLLQVSRAGTAKIKIEEVEISSLVEDAKANLINLIKDNDTTIHCNKSMTADVNPAQMTLVFQHLIENSIKYRSAAAPVVTIDVDNSDEGLTIAVSDNGIGIEAHNHEKVFQIFQRVDPLGDVKGRGIGLTLVKRFVENHHGEIRLDSKPDQGTIVFIQLSQFGKTPSIN
jgi:signal transduction histidine kinase